MSSPLVGGGQTGRLDAIWRRSVAPPALEQPGNVIYVPQIMQKRGTGSRVLRLAASALAVVGLLGHGLAMLLVGLLYQTPAEAQSGVPAFVEICSPSGAKKLAWNDGSGRIVAPTGDSLPASDPSSGQIDGCPVCSAFAQNGPADLPQALVSLSSKDHVALAWPADQVTAAAPRRLLALSRGPPPAA